MNNITFALEPQLTATQRRYNTNKLTLFTSNTKWKGNELPKIDLNCVVVNNYILVKSDTVKLSPFQDDVDVDFEDVCDGYTSDLEIQTI